jgi:hypothetical protein
MGAERTGSGSFGGLATTIVFSSGSPARLSARRAPPGLLLSVVPRCSSRARRPERVVGVFRELPAWSRLRRMSVRGVRCRVKGQRDIEHYRVGPCDTA